MSKYPWCSDIHLDHVDDSKLIEFAQSLIATDPPGVMITGDISNSKRLVYHLSVIERIVQRPTFFVLGNNDYHNGEIESVRKSMRELSNMSQYLKYMPLSPYIVLTSNTAVVGHDGWYDALHGNPDDSEFMLPDWSLIKDYLHSSGGGQYMSMTRSVKDKIEVIAISRKLAREGVAHVMNGIKFAARHHKNIIVLTHVPPFQKSHIYNGKIGSAAAQPWFTSKMMGDMLLDASKTYPNINFTVLCGHTHGRYDGKFAPNLHVHVAEARRGKPTLAGLIDVP